MAKIDLKFLDCNDESYIKVHKDDDMIWISGIFSDKLRIQDDKIKDDVEFIITLDKSTAIKFAKTLRTEINKIQD